MIMDTSLNLLLRAGFGGFLGHIPGSWKFSTWQKGCFSRAALVTSYPVSAGRERR